MKALKIFQFLRGAVRSAYGTEDFRNKKILIVGMGPEGQSFLPSLCFPGAQIFFRDSLLNNYAKAFFICRDVSFYEGDIADITINFEEGTLRIKGRSFPMSSIQEDAYNQGIHEFYLAN